MRDHESALKSASSSRKKKCGMEESAMIIDTRKKRGLCITERAYALRRDYFVINFEE